MAKTWPIARKAYAAPSPTCLKEALLFHRTIAENISLRPPPTPPWSRFARRRVGQTRWSSSRTCRKGSKTITGERGVKLSGGQRQRVAIAPRCWQTAPCWCLTRATSALDSESEALVQDALKTLMRGRTCIVVAHRLSTVASLDRIVVLDHGKVVEDGPHAELIKAGGEYAHLWDRQTGAYLE